jgi:hypothetical protein
MTLPNTALNINQEVVLPKVVILPLGLSNRTHTPRQLVIQGRDQVVPAVVKQWMLRDRRYSSWFAEAEVTEAAAAAAAAEPSPATEPTRWSEDMTVVELRDYADAGGIDLSGATLKNDIIARLREAAGGLEGR